MKFTSLACLSFLPIASGNNVRGRSGERKLPEQGGEDPHCVNTEPFGLIDEGCDSLYPICALDNGFEPAADVSGNTCAKCINTVDDDLFNDMGCEGEYSQCDAPLGKVGRSCVKPTMEPFVCKNTAAYGGIDEGCSLETPICIDSGSGMEVSSHVVGDKCVACVKVYSQGYYDAGIADFGCSADAPRCMTVEETDVATLQPGAQCCAADGTCASACPCNTPGSGWERAVNAPHPLGDSRTCWHTAGYSTYMDWFSRTGLAMLSHVNYQGAPKCATWQWSNGVYLGVPEWKVITATEALACNKEVQDIYEKHYPGTCPPAPF